MFVYKTFISHNKNDKKLARSIGKALIENNVDVWFDEWSLYAGDSLTDGISRGLTESNIFLLINSENSNKSDWVKEELRYALNERISNKNFKIIVVRLDNADLHPFLKDYLWIDYISENSFKTLINNLMNSILRIEKKPQRQAIKSSFYLDGLNYEIHFTGIRGYKANVKETYHLTALKNFSSINKEIYHSGELISKSIDLIKPRDLFSSIQTLEKNNALERLRINFSREIKANENIQFIFRHTIQNNFNEDNEFVYYKVESELKRINFRFFFDKECEAHDLRILKRVGQKEVLLKKTKSNRQINYVNYLPSLFDNFVFKWTWL
jgi:hypothetical protein